MGITEDLADKLARDTIIAAEELGDDNLVAEVSRVIGAASVTTQEAFMTAIRVRLSERRAQQYLAERLKQGPKNPGGPKIELGSRQILDVSEDNPGGH
jgi:hypothetical protein